MYLPLVEKMTYRHEPHLTFQAVKLCHAAINEPGERLLIAYPAVVFFVSLSSLTTCLFVPLYMAAMIASL